MSNGFSIEQVKGTPLYALAQNANVNGGSTLDAQEMAMFQSQMKDMGWTPEQFGLAIETTENAGETAKQTRKNIEEAGKDLEKSYKSQFGKQGAQAAEKAEQRAASVVRTAYDMFNSEHPNSNFVPKQLGARPKFTAPEYKDDASTYAADMLVWANNVKTEYMNATKMSNEQLAAIIIQNDNNNAKDIIINNNITADQVTNEVHKAANSVKNTVHNEANKTRKAVYSESDAIRDDIQRHDMSSTEQNIRLGNLVIDEGFATRNAVREARNDVINNTNANAKEIMDNDKAIAKEIQEKIEKEGDKVIDTLDPLYVNRAIKGARDAAAAAGKSVVEFVKENPGFLFYGIAGHYLIDKGLLQ